MFVMFSLDAMSLSTIDTEMQYFVISLLHVVHRKTAFIVMKHFNTLDTEMLYFQCHHWMVCSEKQHL